MAKMTPDGFWGPDSPNGQDGLNDQVDPDIQDGHMALMSRMAKMVLMSRMARMVLMSRMAPMAREVRLSRGPPRCPGQLVPDRCEGRCWSPPSWIYHCARALQPLG